MEIQNYNLKCRQGVTLTELLISMIIGAVLFLAIGVITKIAISANTKNIRETQYHADVAYGFKLMGKQVREAKKIQDIDTPGNPWVGQRVILTPHTGNDRTFGLYNNGGTGAVEFIYMDDVTLDVNNINNRDVIISVSSPFTITLVPQCDTAPPACKVIETTVQIKDANGRVICDLSSKIARRM